MEGVRDLVAQVKASAESWKRSVDEPGTASANVARARSEAGGDAPSVRALINLFRELRKQVYWELYHGQNVEPRSGLAREGIERHFASMEERDAWYRTTHGLSVLFWSYDFVVVELILLSLCAQVQGFFRTPEEADIALGAFGLRLILKRVRQAAHWARLGSQYWFGDRGEALVSLAGYIVHRGFRVEHAALRRAADEHGVSKNDARYVLAHEAASEVAFRVLLPTNFPPNDASPVWLLPLPERTLSYRNPLMEFELNACRRGSGSLIRQWYGDPAPPLDLSDALAEERILPAGRCTTEDPTDFLPELLERLSSEHFVRKMQSMRLPPALTRARDDLVAAAHRGDNLDRASIAARTGQSLEAVTKQVQRLRDAVSGQFDGSDWAA